MSDNEVKEAMHARIACMHAQQQQLQLRDGYLPIAQMLASHGAIFNCMCIEMHDHEQPQDTLCAPEKLVRQVALATQEAEVPPAGENVLQRYDDYAHEQIIRASQLNVDGSLENVGTTGKMILIFPVHPKNTLQRTLLSIQR